MYLSLASVNFENHSKRGLMKLSLKKLLAGMVLLGLLTTVAKAGDGYAVTYNYYPDNNPYWRVGLTFDTPVVFVKGCGIWGWNYSGRAIPRICFSDSSTITLSADDVNIGYKAPRGKKIVYMEFVHSLRDPTAIIHPYIESLILCDDITDSDSDGLGNLAEFNAATDYFNPDTDADGLTDGLEVLTYQTDPNDRDSDDDGAIDFTEVARGRNPWVADTWYQATVIADFNAGPVSVASVNNNLEVVGTRRNTETGYGSSSFMFKNGTVQDFPLLDGVPGGILFDAKCINDSGVVVGGGRGYGCIMYSPTKGYQRPHKVAYSTLYSVNNARNISVGFDGGDKALRCLPLGSSFMTTRGIVTDLPLYYELKQLNPAFSPQLSVMTGINDINQNIGYTRMTYDGVTRDCGFIVSANGTIGLATLGGKSTWPKDINNQGTVVGTSLINSEYGIRHAFAYINGIMKDLGAFDASPMMQEMGVLPHGANSEALMVNEENQVLGWSESPTGGKVFLYENDVMSDLSAMIIAGNLQGLSLQPSAAINDMKEIVIAAKDTQTSAWKLVMLTPVR